MYRFAGLTGSSSKALIITQSESGLTHVGRITWPSISKFSHSKWSGMIGSSKHPKEEGAKNSDNLRVIQGIFLNFLNS